MKISKFILTILITISLFAFSANKASAFSNEKEQNEHRGYDDNKGKNDDNKGGSGGACLPINGQAWFLLFAGLAIGTYVIYNNSKATALKAVTVKR